MKCRIRMKFRIGVLWHIYYIASFHRHSWRVKNSRHTDSGYIHTQKRRYTFVMMRILSRIHKRPLSNSSGSYPELAGKKQCHETWKKRGIFKRHSLSSQLFFLFSIIAIVFFILCHFIYILYCFCMRNSFENSHKYLKKKIEYCLWV